MATVAQGDKLAQLPVGELEHSLQVFLRPVTALLPDRRLGRVAELLVRGLVASQSPIITRVARGSAPTRGQLWARCQRAYRFLANPRLSARQLRKGLYRLGQAVVAKYAPERLVVAVDPVNFEKPYTVKLDGVSTVIKRTPPSYTGDKRKTHGYPAITASVVNLPQPAISYAQWFSYVTADFVGLNREVQRACRMTRSLFPGQRLRFVADSGLDDQKVFDYLQRLPAEFVIRVCHDRRVEVFNDRLQRWESELLFDLVASLAFDLEQEVCFTHAGRERRVRLQLGWLHVRLPGTRQDLWLLVTHDPQREFDLCLLTNVPLTDPATVRQVFSDWRLRSRIEHGYRFDQEDGLDVEDMRVATLERMRRLFILVLLAAQFICAVDRHWPVEAVRWLRQLGGKLDRPTDRDGLYLLLRGIGAVWQALATVHLAAQHPFPRTQPCCV